MNYGVFTCGRCRGTFPKAWSDAEAEQERKRLYPWLLDEDAEVVCDDCWRDLGKEHPEIAEEIKRREA